MTQLEITYYEAIKRINKENGYVKAPALVSTGTLCQPAQLTRPAAISAKGDEMIQKTKEVYIKGNSLAWFVVPVSRNKYQRHALAQFDRRLYTIETVKEYIKNNDKLVMTKGISEGMII